MTSKADFNAEEWSLLAEAPALAGILVATAERGGMLRESFSIAGAYSDARKQEGPELLDELVSSPPGIDPRRYSSREELRSDIPQRLREAIASLEAKATPEEADAYRGFVVDVAKRVAESHKEGGFIGIGGRPISDSERATLDEIADWIGAERPT